MFVLSRTDFVPERTTFLNHAAKIIQGDDFSGKKLVITPNKRSLFRLRHMVPEADFETVDELMQKLSGSNLIEPEELLITFYQAYKRLEENAQPFNEFSKWAITFLGDVNEIDLYLQNVSSIYEHISAYHSTGEGFDGKEKGELESSYLSFWERLPEYYQALKTDLAKLQLSYRGSIYRTVVENLESSPAKIEKAFDGYRLYWLGIVPGNPCEHRLLEWLDARSQLKTLVDVDHYYLDRKLHEAGRPFREQKFLDNSDEPTNLLLNSQYDFKIHPLTGRFAQIMRLKTLIEDISEEEYGNSAIILADLTLVQPLSSLIQDKGLKIHLTSGYPLRNTTIHRFHMSWINLHQTSITRNGEKAFYHKFLKEFFEFPVVQEWLAGAIEWKSLKDRIVKKNIKYVPLSWLQESLNDDLFAREALRLLFEWDAESSTLFQTISEILGNWRSAEGGIKISKFDQVCLDAYIEKLNLFLTQFNEVVEEADLTLLKQFIHRHMAHARMHSELDDEDGLHAMTLFETRLLDFKHLIFVGASDDHLPGSMHKVSHIPMIHRLHFGLPTRRDSESLYSYHFYRLLQRSERVDFIYDTSMNALSGGEPSRYIAQLKEELTRQNLKASISLVKEANVLMESFQNELSITKTEDVVNSLKAALKNNLSASRINQFINSPLEFYFYYILKVKEEDRVEEIIESSTFGNIVHKVLEEIYKPFIGELIDLEQLQKAIRISDEITERVFESYFERAEFQTGQNLISLHVIKEYIKGFVEWDVAEMKENGPVRLLSLELRMSERFKSNGLEINLYGVADRIDSRNGEIRVIDYKSGKVEASELAYDEERIGVDFKHGKALQIALYIYLYCQRHNLDESQVGGYVYSFKNRKAGYISLTVKSMGSDSLLDSFAQRLDSLVSEMLDPSTPFTHHEDSKYLTV
ncbi:MAG: PD-(D/E)XK nuclease family protein [Flavobacteriales bacterium]|jgi:ATP-dependent helicase/nuclease subunit B|nr:PD-(D/E)XK nuclease family protein [Flavobacteriales bacterium]NCG29326.1 hypothetical protein [Bacteroidota bacterium]MBT3963824.1 PD-(D/E)XK nuclease family protein [Flavobacteriales bacterium]MBT4704713.1 PD-(D/E)XK nuclease family protein [Flavobacteriales bacterium]MBT4931704.1 PD-(D/E)XK nuclease family protein [Flavobacteriales bacterium]